MAIVQETRCDMCGKVLVGWIGRQKVSRSYIEFAGFMRDWAADPDTGWREFTFISPPDKRQMAFCTDDEATCLMDYMLMKREANRVRREQELRDGATAEYAERNLPPPRYGAPPPVSPPRAGN